MWTIPNCKLPSATVTLAALLAASLNAGAAETALRWKFKEGQTIYETTLSTTTMEARGGVGLHGRETRRFQMKIRSSETTLDSKWEVRKVEFDGAAEIMQKIERIRLVMSIPGQAPLNYDSAEAKEPEGPEGTKIAPLFKLMIASPITLRMTSRGEVTEVKVPKELQEAFANLPGTPLKELFSEEVVKQPWNAICFPAEPVAVGKTWTNKAKMSQPFGTIHLFSVQTYMGVENHAGRELSQVDIKGSTGFENGAQSKVDVKFKDFDLSGKAYFDPEAGRWVEIEQVQKMTLLASVGENAGPAPELRMVMTQKIQFADTKPKDEPSAPAKEKEAK